MKQWVEDNHENQGNNRLIYKHNQTLLKENFKWFLFREDCRQHHRVCLASLKLLTKEDPSEYREINKQSMLQRKKAVSKFSIKYLFTFHSCWYHNDTLLSSPQILYLYYNIFINFDLILIQNGMQLQDNEIMGILSVGLLVIFFVFCMCDYFQLNTVAFLDMAFLDYMIASKYISYHQSQYIKYHQY